MIAGGQRDHFGREPYPREQGGRGRADGALPTGAFARAGQYVCGINEGSGGDAPCDNASRGKVWRARKGAAVRFQEMKKPAAVSGAGFETFAMMSLCQ